jgi:V8-like Glu-specific endopeptidase
MALTRSSRKLWYTRYADDITLSTKETTFNQDIVRLAEDGSIVAGDVLTSIIESNGFTINSKKTRLHSGFAPKYITGVKVNEKLNLDRRYIRGIRAILYKIKTKGLDEVNKEFVKKYSKGSTNISNTVFGMIQHVGYIRGQIDPVYRKLWNSYCDAEGKGRHYLAVDMLDQILEKVFVINAGTEQGSGFFVEKMLITCGHVVSPHVAGKGYIDSLNEIQYHNFQNISSTQFSRSTNPVVCKNELDIVGYYSHFNLQHLLAESSFDIGDATSLGLGDTVFCLGYADYKLGNKPEYYEAKIVSIIPNKDGVKEYNIDKTLFAGMSGGPVLNSKYQVVGVVARGAQSRHERQHESTSVFLSLSEYFQ